MKEADWAWLLFALMWWMVSIISGFASYGWLKTASYLYLCGSQKETLETEVMWKIEALTSNVREENLKFILNTFSFSNGSLWKFN